MLCEKAWLGMNCPLEITTIYMLHVILKFLTTSLLTITTSSLHLPPEALLHSMQANKCLPKIHHESVQGQQKENKALCTEGNQSTFLRFCTSIKIFAQISDVMWQRGKNIGKREQGNTQ